MAKDKKPEIKNIPTLSKGEATAKSATDDDKSTAEAKQLSGGLSGDQIKKRANTNEANRTEKFRDHFEKLSIISLYVLWGAVMVMGLCWVIHLVLPDKFHYLAQEQLKTLQSILTGGIIAGIAGGHTKRRLENNNHPTP